MDENAAPVDYHDPRAYHGEEWRSPYAKHDGIYAQDPTLDDFGRYCWTEFEFPPWTPENESPWNWLNLTPLRRTYDTNYCLWRHHEEFRQFRRRIDALERIVLGEENLAAPRNQSSNPGANPRTPPRTSDALEKTIQRLEQQVERIAVLEKTMFGEHYRFSPKIQSSSPGVHSETPPQNSQRQSFQVYSTSSPGAEPDRPQNQNKRQRPSSQNSESWWQNSENWWPGTTVAYTPA